MIRRFLYLILAIALMAMPVSAAEFTDIDADAVYFEQVSVLNALGIISAKDDSSFRPDDTMTKGEFTEIIIRNLMKIDTEIESVPQIFTDVSKNHKYAVSIYSAYRAGLAIGNPGSYYGADNAVKTGEAVKILINALGYNVYAESKGGYPAGYMAQASILRLLNGVPAGSETVLKRYEVANLLYNSLKADLMSIDMVGNQVSYNVTKGKNVLTEFLSCNVVEGIVDRVPETGLTDPGSELLKNELYIGGVSYGAKNIIAGSFLGYKVRAYYSVNRETDEREIIYISKNGNKELTIRSEFLKDYKDFTLTYSNDEFDDVDRQIKLSNKTDFIFNGKAWPDAPSSGTLTAYGTITLVDNGTDSRYNIAIINSYEDYVVNSLSQRDRVIYSKSGDILDLYDIEDKNIKIFDLDGEQVLLNSIKEEDILTVKMSKDKKAVEIWISNEKLEGTITEINTDEVEINYLSRVISPSFDTEFRTLPVGFSGTFYIDIFGGVAGVVSNDDLNEKYGYLVGVTDSKKLDENIRAKIYTHDGKMFIADAANRITINEVTNQTPEALLTTFMTTTGGEKHTVMQVIKYRLGGDGTLKEITGQSMLDEVSIGSTKWSQEPRSFGSLVLTSANTSWFVVPNAIGAAANSVTDRNFSNITNLSDNVAYTNEFFAYDVDDGGVAAVLVRKTAFSNDNPIGGLAGDEPPTTNTYVMVTSISTVVNAEGETVPKINFIERGAMTGYPVKNENIAKKYQYKKTGGVYDYVASSEDSKPVVIADTSLPPKILERGDIIQYKLNDAQEIVGIMVVHDISRETSGFEKMVINSDGIPTYPNKNLMRSGEDRGYVYGTVKSQKNGFIKLEARLYAPADDPFKLFSYNVKASPITVYDIASDQIYKGEFGDITDEKTAGIGSKVFIHNHWYRTSEVFVYKNLVERP